MAAGNQEAVNAMSGSTGDDTDGPSAKRMRHQGVGTQEAFLHNAPQHLLSAPGPSSQLNVQALYQMQLPHATLQQPVMPHSGQAGPPMLQLPPHPEADQQHLPPSDQGMIDPQANHLQNTDTGEASLPLPSNTDYKHKPRRKATERPSGTDQIRQAFSKRKRGLALKCYQLHKLTDAKVFCFIMNEKGTSWAYATPGFGASLSNSSLRHMRNLTGIEQPSDMGKQVTEVISHPAAGDADDREAYASAAMPMDAAPNTILVSGPEYDAEPEVTDSGATRDVGVQVTSHLQMVYHNMQEAPLPTLDAQAGPDEVRNFVADMAHLAYSRGLPGGPSGSAPPDGHLAPGGLPMMHQTLMNVPLHLIPGHPSFDQQAYQLLLQQQHEQQNQQLQQQQQHHFQSQGHQHQEQVADIDGEVRNLPDTEHALSTQNTIEQDSERQESRLESQSPAMVNDA